jgi:hypothetical protein
VRLQERFEKITRLMVLLQMPLILGTVAFAVW